MKKLVKESLNEIKRYSIKGDRYEAFDDETEEREAGRVEAVDSIDGPRTSLKYIPDTNTGETFSKNEVGKILKSIIGYTKEPGRLCGNLDNKIKTLAKKHGIKL